MRPKFLFLLLVLISHFASAQIMIGEWREHLPYQKAKQLSASTEMIFCLTESGLFNYSLIDNEITPFSKTKGLSESQVSSTAWSEETKSLLVGYANGNLDIISDGEIHNIPDIKRSSLADNKMINSITLDDNFAYLGTGFGIVVVNLDKQEIADTYFIGDGGEKLQVNDVLKSSTEIWGATDKGVFKASLSANNLADFNNWEHISDLPDYLNPCDHLLLWQNNIVITRSLSETLSEIFLHENDNWTKFTGNFQKIHSIRSFDGELWVIQPQFVQIFSSSGLENQRLEYADTEIRDAIKLDGRIFIADFQKSLVELEGNSFTSLKPDGPLRRDITALYSKGKETWAVAGAYNDSFEGQNIDAELYLFKNQEWINFSKDNVPELVNQSDLVYLTGNQRKESLVYASSWGDGIFVFENETLTETWNASNSPLGSKGVGAMASDKEGNLWILDANSTSPVKVRTWENQWISLSYPELTNRPDLQKILVISNNDKWVLRSPGQALFAFNNNSTPANNEDDFSTSFFARDENNSIISSDVYDMVEDEQGDIWLATANGVAIYPNPDALFQSGDFFAYRPVITIDGSTQFLLGSEKILSIALDGANQKWLGTENSGVFLVSEDGEEQIFHFTTENSPLPSNKVESISANPGTGEVFFITNEGLVSYKGKVTRGNDSYNDLYVYPNPVRETFHGDIVVTGLISNSIVKITDVSGNLVYEGKSAGGQFIWDGENFNGSRVHTGVYLIFCSSPDGSQSKVVKLLFIN